MNLIEFERMKMFKDFKVIYLQIEAFITESFRMNKINSKTSSKSPLTKEICEEGEVCSGSVKKP